VFKLHNLSLVIDNLEITVYQEGSIKIHLFEESLLVVKENFILCDFCLHLALKLVQFIVIDCLLLVVHYLLNLAIQVANLFLLCLYLIH